MNNRYETKKIFLINNIIILSIIILMEFLFFNFSKMPIDKNYNNGGKSIAEQINFL